MYRFGRLIKDSGNVKKYTDKGYKTKATKSGALVYKEYPSVSGTDSQV